MEQYILEWDRESILAAIGQMKGNRVSLRSIHRIDRTKEDAGSLSSQLQTIFGTGGGKAALPVTVLLPRQAVTIHRISLPMVPEADMPDMVRMQAAIKLTVPVESVCLDFAPLPALADATARDVLLVTSPVDQINRIRRTLADAGLELKAVRATSFSIASAAVHAGVVSAERGSAGVEAIALLKSDVIEVTFTRGEAVLFSHSGAGWSTLDGVTKAVKSELARARMAAAEVLGDLKVSRLHLVGAKEITSLVEEDAATRVDNASMDRIDPAEGIFEHDGTTEIPAADLIALAGSVYSQVESRVPEVDLVNPRRPPVKQDYRRVQLLGAALALLVLFGLAWNWRQNKIRVLSADLESLQDKANDINSTLQLGKNDLVLAELVSDWVDRDINWLDQMTTLKDLLPDTDRFLVREIKAGVKSGREIGSIRLDGVAKSVAEIEQMARRLSDAGYIVEPYTPENTSRTAGYPFSISMQLQIPKPQEVAPGSGKSGNKA
ncbi:MAG: hypothetical protein KDA91_17745 [Planctomycetaceae bacterium]|nr:hypothetical protein [Planctomycetaceae bacterium]